MKPTTGLGDPGDWDLFAEINDPTVMATDPQTHPVSAVNTWFYRIHAISATRGPSAWSELALTNEIEDAVVKVTAEASTAPQPEIKLEWLVQKNHYLDEFGAVRDDEYVIRRKQLGESEWTTLVPNATESLPVSMHTDGMLSWTDTDVAVGQAFEYAIERTTDPTTGPVKAEGYLYGGIDLPLVDDRGTLLLVIAKQLFDCDGNGENCVIKPELADKVERLERDLVGDGWTVEQIIADPDPAETGIEDSGQAVSAVKQQIKAYYDDHENYDVKAVFLLGNVPVPYSGYQAPDAHANRTLPADTYYGDVDAEFFDPDPNDPSFLISLGWMDDTVNITQDTSDDADGSVTNVPGDGRFDNNDVPDDGSGRDVELLVGRVDLSDVSEFTNDIEGSPTGLELELELLARYLDKDHAFRHGEFDVPRRGRIVIGSASGGAIEQWRNYSAIVGHDSVTRENWLMHMDDPEFAAIFASASSRAPDEHGINIPDGDFDLAGNRARVTIRDMVPRENLTVFHAISGSYLVDWSKSNSLMQGFLANDGYGLTAQWNASGDDLLWLQHMALGQTIGFANYVSQGALEGTRKVPTYRDLLGDPTPRAHAVKPPSNVQVADTGGEVTVFWNAAPDTVWEYRVYRKAEISTEFVHVGTTTELSLPNVTGTTSDEYMVRAVKLEATPSGTYFNASQGAYWPE